MTDNQDIINNEKQQQRLQYRNNNNEDDVDNEDDYDWMSSSEAEEEFDDDDDDDSLSSSSLSSASSSSSSSGSSAYYYMEADEWEEEDKSNNQPVLLQNQNNNNNNNDVDQEVLDDDNNTSSFDFTYYYNRPDIILRAVSILHDAIYYIMSLRNDYTFRIVSEKYPNIVMKECNPLHYIYSCKFNEWAAAVKICNYWSLRKQIFGDARYYRPILDIKTNNGALSTGAIQYIYSGCFYILPIKDKDGKQIIFRLITKEMNDKLDKLGITEQHRCEAVFYMFHILTENLNDCINGCRMVAITTQSKPKMHIQARDVFLKSSRDCFPIQLHTIHFLYAPDPTEKEISILSTLYNQFLPFFNDLLQRNFLCLPRRTVHFINTRSLSDKQNNNTSSNTLLYLQYKIATWLINDIGLQYHGLPPIAGGSCCINTFLQWIQQNRQNVEQLQQQQIIGKKIDMISLSRAFLYSRNAHVIEPDK